MLYGIGWFIVGQYFPLYSSAKKGEKSNSIIYVQILGDSISTFDIDGIWRYFLWNYESDRNKNNSKNLQVNYTIF